MNRIKSEVDAFIHGLWSSIALLWKRDILHQEVRWGDERGLRSISCSCGRVFYKRADVDEVPNFDEVRKKFFEEGEK